MHLTNFSQGVLNSESKEGVALGVANLVKEMMTKGSPLNLASLKKAIGRKKTVFLGSAQQDAQEYLNTLLEILNDELTRIKSKGKYREMEGDPNKKSICQLVN